MEHKDIEALAAKFRTALEAFAKEPEAIWKTIYNSFPDGCCNDASMLLAAYLTDSGFPGAMRVHGEYGGRSGKILSHVWLSLDGLIIDITADQFEGPFHHCSCWSPVNSTKALRSRKRSRSQIFG